jgi:hypothetical protein
MTPRTKRGLRIGGLVAVVASAWMAQSAAAQGERLTVEVGDCVNLPTPEQRLACFEAQVEAARGASAGAPAAPAPAATSAAPAPAPSTAPAPAAASAAPAAAAATSTAAPPPTTTAVPAASSTAPAEFGFRERPEEAEGVPPPAEVRAKVAELRETVPNAFLITLDNGQVWRQTRPDPYLSLRVGQDVRIYFSRWRAYRLESPQVRGFLQVERVR